MDGKNVYAPGSHPTRKEALAALKTVVGAPRAPILDVPYSEAYARIFESRLAHELRPRSQDLARDVDAKTADTALGRTVVRDLKPSHFRDWMNALECPVYGPPGPTTGKKGYRPRTVVGHRPLSAASKKRYLGMHKAVCSRIAEECPGWPNPAKTVKPPRVAETSKRIVPRADVDRLLSLLDPQLRLAAVLAASGVRPGEMCALKPDDLKDGLVTVARSVAAIADGRLVLQPTTKTYKNRKVPLLAKYAALWPDSSKPPRPCDKGEGAGGEGRSGSPPSSAGMPVPEDEGGARGGRSGPIASPVTPTWIFPGRDGAPLSPKLLALRFRRALAGTEFEGLSLYDLRSSQATWLLAMVGDPRVAAQILGNSPAVVARDYARASADDLRRALEATMGDEAKAG